MNELIEILSRGGGRVTIQVGGEDLLEFADAIIARTSERIRQEQEQKRDTGLVPKKDVMAMLGVCNTTLWQWARSGYLVPVKVGRKVMYRKRDVYILFSSSNSNGSNGERK